MRTARFLLLIVYITGHTGLPLPLPAGARAGGVCGCGEVCQCAPQNIAAGNCCCAAKSAAVCPAKGASLCTATSARTRAAKARTCCGESKAGACCDDERPQPPVLLACGCQQDAPEGIAACSDPRVLSDAVGPPRSRGGDRLTPARGPAAGLLEQSPDDPVPRLTA